MTSTKTNEATQEFLSGRLAQVDINRIEKELKALWSSAAESTESGEPKSVTRACVMNLILYAEEIQAENLAGDLLDEITSRHPCRAILAISRPGEPRSLEALVSARCRIGGEKRKQICCEQITVRGQGVNADELGSVVGPLIIPDLPVFLWWRTVGLKSERLDPLLPLVDKLIVDSACQPDNLKFFRDLLDIVNDRRTLPGHGRVTCTDLNWRRSLPWREAIALSFDPRHSEQSLEYLNGIQAIEIAYGQPEPQERPGHKSEPCTGDGLGLLNQSLLWVGWLSTRLGWKLESAKAVGDQRYEIKYKSTSGAPVVSLFGVDADRAAKGDIGSIAVSTNKPEAVRIIARQEKGTPGIQVNKTSHAGGRAGIIPPEQALLHLDEKPEGTLIDKELETVGRDRVLHEAVQGVIAVLEALDK